VSGRRITSKQADKVLEGLRMGMTRRAAAGFAHMDRVTLWRMIGRDATFATAVENAEGEAEATYSAIVARATADPRNWTAAAWWLERRHPSDYGKRERVEMTGKDGGPIDYRELANLPDHEREALSAAIRDHLRGEQEPAEDPARTGED
jgi:hypothetical protein